MAPPFAADGKDVVLRLRITPRAGRDAFGPASEDLLAVRLAAPPVEGAANKALIAFLADAFSVPRSAVRIESGERSRCKRVRVSGVTAEASRGASRGTETELVRPRRQLEESALPRDRRATMPLSSPRLL
jgi:uncharacterized protein (TIGR00251 family)